MRCMSINDASASDVQKKTAAMAIWLPFCRFTNLYVPKDWSLGECLTYIVV